MGNNILPVIIGCGLYDSRVKYKNIIETPKRKVTSYEIELYSEDGGIAYVDDEVYEYKKNHVLFARPGQIRNSRLHLKCYYIKMFLEGDDLIRKLDNIYTMIPVTDPDKYLDLFLTIIENYNSSFDGSEILLGSKVMELLFHLYKDSQCISRQKHISQPFNTKILKNALEYIDANYSLQISLEDIAKAVNLSPIYFHQIFKQAIGQTPHRYLLMRRLQRAKKMLLTSEMPLSEVALASGFTSQSYFNYVFKKETGLTPKQFREKGSLEYS